MSKIKNIVKEFYIKEHEDIEPIGGPTVSPNEFAYFDFKSWAYDVGTKELSTLKGYYGSITLENDSTKKAELFSVSAEVTESSK